MVHAPARYRYRWNSGRRVGARCGDFPVVSVGFLSPKLSDPLGGVVISTARTCNCILIVLDAIKPITHKRLIEKELEGFGIRLNKEPPNMTFRKKEKGGINLTSTVTNTHLDLDTVKAICSEYRIHNADVHLRYDATADDLIDVIEGSRVYTPCIYVVNKIDQITMEELEILDKLPHYCPIR
ncbi:Developmentally-regulated GTP-binding protein 1 [Capsicum chinense]|nr:Developmentally-regulated GTP-binding protein 1 [Capsicum chinense]